MLASCFAAAQDPTPWDVEMAQALQQAAGGGFAGGRGGGQVIISPDGKQIAWSGQPPAGKGESGLWVMNLAGGDARRVQLPVRDIAWSPDGEWISHVTSSGGESSINFVPVTPGDSLFPAHFKGQVGQPVWSPDGKSIAFLGIENPTRVSGATQPFKPQTGVVGSTSDVQRLVVLDVMSGHWKWASPPGLYVYEFGWAPDSRQVAITAAAPPGENNWWTAKLYALDIATATSSVVTTPEFQLNYPRWSSDGKWIAYIGGVMSDFGSIGGDVYVVPASGGRATDVTPGFKGSATSIQWLAGGQILVAATIDGESGIMTLDPQSRTLHLVVHAAGSFSGDGRSGMAVSADGSSAAYTSSTLDHPSELYAGPIGHARQLSHWGDGSRPHWGKITSLHWSSGGRQVQGWLIAPAKMEPGKSYPMLVQVHGGPAAAVNASWFLGQGAAFWSQAGYFVFEPNPRGSYGQGEDFTKANRRDFGYGDWKDIMAGVDKVLQVAPVNPNRLGLTGGSYGGYMTMWGVTQTKRFKAAIAVAGIANWLSYYGENSIDQWMLPYFGASVYDDPKVYARSSPISFIKQVRTPTLVVVGEYDGECPPPQSYEFWHALRDLGIKTELLVYPNEGHGVRLPENRRDLTARELAWFNFYLR